MSQAVDIDVSVRSLDGDTETWWPLYTTRREFVAETITLNLDPQDHPTLDAFPTVQPPAGSLAIPTARTVRFTLTAAVRVDPNYFDFDAGNLKTLITINVEVRADAAAEEPLFTPVDLPVRAFFFQPLPTDGSVANPVDRLAQELGLSSSRLTVSGRPGPTGPRSRALPDCTTRSPLSCPPSPLPLMPI